MQRDLNNNDADHDQQTGVFGFSAHRAQWVDAFMLKPEIGAIATANKPALSNLEELCTYGAPGDPCLDAWYQGKGQYAQGPLNAIMVKTSNATERDLFIFGIPSRSFRGYWPAEIVNKIPQDPPSTWDSPS